MNHGNKKQRRALLRGAIGIALGLGAGAAARADEAYDRIRATGILKVGVYKEFFPFADDEAGIDVDIAKALATQLGLKLKLLPFDAGDDVGDDLRNMVWKGHYLGYGPADVLLHVPVDRVLQEANKQVEIFGPYWREQLEVARNTERLPDWTGFDVFQKEKIVVDGASISSIAMLSLEAGRYRENVINAHDIKVALDTFRNGGAAAVMGTRAELQAGLAGMSDVAIEPVKIPGLPVSGWAVGMAVKAESMDLAHALQGALNQIIDSGAMAAIFARHNVRYVRP
ncbi:substrate-binding periplasmic protein [Derxia gummosa]|uniref:Substrate-binding periplasmic protein n=1 Tax=Derxia gummosa DSM 723 TaxID=1121388 RepID=A0A8B6X113_9BURK|nr:transporter substrate-binding domain-containing protein [Derxia gummosa]